MVPVGGLCAAVAVEGWSNALLQWCHSGRRIVSGAQMLNRLYEWLLIFNFA